MNYDMFSFYTEPTVELADNSSDCNESELDYITADMLNLNDENEYSVTTDMFKLND